MRKIPGNVTKLSRPGIYKAKLAEDYDGIGQYVLVALSGSSVSSAYKARVATGDFGGSRTFPAGTPVTIVYDHGQIEVFLGNIPTKCLRDDFDREVAAGVGFSHAGWADGLLEMPISGSSPSQTTGITGGRAYITGPAIVGQGYASYGRDQHLLPSSTPLFTPGMTVSAQFEPTNGLDVGGSNGLGGPSGVRFDCWTYEPLWNLGDFVFPQGGFLISVGRTGSTSAGTFKFRASVFVLVNDEDFNELVSYSAIFEYPTSWRSPNGQVFVTKAMINYEDISVKTWPVAEPEPADWDIVFSGWDVQLFTEAMSFNPFTVEFGLESSEGNTTYLDWIEYCRGGAPSLPS